MRPRVVLHALALLALPGVLRAGTCHAPVVAAPAYSYVAPVVVVRERVIVKEVPFAVPYAYFAFVAAPTTPPPVLVAAPQPVAAAAPVAAPAAPPACAPPPCAAAAPCAQAPTGGYGAHPPAANGVEARLARIEAALAGLARQGAPYPDAPPAAVGLEENSPPPPTKVPDGARVALFQARCAQCHTGADGRGGVQLFDQSGTFAPNVSDEEITRAVRSGKMPRGPLPLTEAEKSIVYGRQPAQEVRR